MSLLHQFELRAVKKRPTVGNIQGERETGFTVKRPLGGKYCWFRHSIAFPTILDRSCVEPKNLELFFFEKKLTICFLLESQTRIRPFCLFHWFWHRNWFGRLTTKPKKSQFFFSRLFFTFFSALTLPLRPRHAGSWFFLCALPSHVILTNLQFSSVGFADMVFHPLIFFPYMVVSTGFFGIIAELKRGCPSSWFFNVVVSTLPKTIISYSPFVFFLFFSIQSVLSFLRLAEVAF